MKTCYASAAVLVLALSAVACGTLRSLSSGLPVPPRVDAPRLDRTLADRPITLPEGFLWLSTPEEPSIAPYMGLTRDAWERILQYTEDLRRGWCEARLSLQRANGQTPDDLPLCRVGPVSGEPQRTGPDFSQPRVYPLSGDGQHP